MSKNNSFVCLLFILLLMPICGYAQKKNNSNKNTVITLSSTNYDQEISKGVVLVDYWAPWCGPCRKLEPVLMDVVNETGIKLGKLNVDNYEAFVSKKNIKTIPTLILYKDGKEVQRLVGLYSKEELLSVVKPYLK